MAKARKTQATDSKLDFQRPLTTVDVVIFTVIEDTLRVLLVKRPHMLEDPFPGMWALPGGFVDVDRDESLEACARRKLKEKYAALWMTTGVLIIPLGFFPTLLDSVAKVVGVRSGVSLILFLSVVFLFMVCLQLSWEVGHLEEETRTLAEEVALLNGSQRTGTPPPDSVAYAAIAVNE